MSLARLRSDPSIKIRAREYQRSKHRDVCCVHCLCAVEGVASTTRTIAEEGKQVFIDAYFRLPKNAEKKGAGHKPNCRFNIGKTLERFVARSKEIKTFDNNAELLFSPTQGKQVELRLHIMMKAIRSASWNSTVEGSNHASEMMATGTRYSSSGRTLRPYLKMAKAVLALISRIQERKYLAEHIVLKYAEYTIRWNRYFFPFGSYCELYEHLAEKPSKNEDRPIALVVKILKMSDKQTQYDNWQIRCTADIGKKGRAGSEAGTPLYLRPLLYVKDKDLADWIAQQEFVLVCALPRLGKLQPASKNYHPEILLNLTINHSAQVCGYTLIEDSDR